jgi:hypothetical protein
MLTVCLLVLNSFINPECAGSCEPGSRCRPNECIFGSWKPRGGRDFGMRGI